MLYRPFSLNRVLAGTALLLVLALTSASDSYAQEDEAEKTALEAGRWALQFQITSNFTLGSFQGSTISFKRHLSEERAWRVGMTLNGDFAQSESEFRLEENDEEEFDDVSTSERNRQSISLAAQYVRYPLAEDPIVFFYGAGPTVGFSREEREAESESEREGQVTEVRETSSNYSVIGGVIGVVGGEWFVRSDLSLTAEYRYRLAYRYTQSEDRRVSIRDAVGVPEYVEVDEGESSSSRFDFGSGQVRFGLSVYF